MYRSKISIVLISIQFLLSHPLWAAEHDLNQSPELAQTERSYSFKDIAREMINLGFTHPDIDPAKVKPPYEIGERVYPVNLEPYQAPKESVFEKDIDTLKKQKLLSFGEGESNFVATLLDNNFDAIAADLSEPYKSKTVKNCKFPDKYVWADVTKTFVTTKKYNVVVSNFLFCPCCVGAKDFARSLQELAKVLAPGGEMRHTFHTMHEDKSIANDYYVALETFLRTQKDLGKNFVVQIKGIGHSENNLPRGLQIFLKEMNPK